MTLADRIKLMDDMIRENPDVTIKDYVELVGELRDIRKANKSEIVLITKLEKKLRTRSPNKISPKYINTYRTRF